jgi:hypothetical protein
MGLSERWNMKTNQFLRAAGLAAAVLALFLSGCTEKNYTVNQCPSETVHIKGTVYAWRCGIRDPVNNHPGSDQNRFSLNTGEAAIVTFIRDNGFRTTVETDDSSNFELYLSAGSHEIEIETGYTYPNPIKRNVQLWPGDTTLALDIGYRVLDPLHISCVFLYPTINDTMSTAAEWAIINKLNLGDYQSKDGIEVLDISGITSPSQWRNVLQSLWTPTVHVDYQLPINRFRSSSNRTLYNVYEGYELLRGALIKDTTGVFPPNFSIYPAGSYICLASL